MRGVRRNHPFASAPRHQPAIRSGVRPPDLPLSRLSRRFCSPEGEGACRHAQFTDALWLLPRALTLSVLVHLASLHRHGGSASAEDLPAGDGVCVEVLLPLVPNPKPTPSIA